MFTRIEVSLVRERNERLLQEIRAARAGRYLRPRRFAPLFYGRRQGGPGGGA